ncbi:Rap1a/Tai family immunity protein [Sphingosinicella sp. BN140058]|uniref:Rap1a/Tai family immunity protein n=1 Tax=Sphingosinicella sp. BN140058 TaxID=1892855 RepID=UPI001010CD53|nr:Rap1a/Tai family immunity protein [Sphingosinicella sp. BN140058]QAY80378.1 hypothetical protein ETR14_27445 [Sphingosinicella sp. BN140058]
MRFLILAAVSIFACAAPAAAQQPGSAPAAQPAGRAGGPTAIELIKLCFEGTANGSVSNPVCQGYLAGAIGAIRISRTVSQDFPICLPEEGMSNLQVVNDVSAYLEQHEDQLQRSARSVLFLVLTELYPCDQGAGAQ